MTVVVTKRTAKMKLGDITLKPDKKTGWWCLIKNMDIYVETPQNLMGRLERVNGGYAFGLCFRDTRVLGKVSSAIKPHWKGVTVGLKEMHNIYPSYGEDVLRVHALINKQEYERLIGTSIHVPTIGYLKKINTSGVFKYAIKENAYVRLPFKPGWIAFSELDNTPLESLK